MASKETFQAINEIETTFGWEVDHIDGKGAFLNAKIPDETIFPHLPNISGPTGFYAQLFRVLKTIYGLREAPKLSTLS